MSAAPQDPEGPTQASGDVDGPPTSVFGVGSRVNRFHLLDKLGEGGMGVVWSAYDPQLDRRVALKLIRSGAEDRGAGSDTTEGQALREARALARLSHPHVLAVYDAGVVGDRIWVAMELVDGEDVGSWILRQHPGWRTILDAYLEAGRGLAAAHAAGLVHRDFKPANVLRGRDGRIRVADFGLAHLLPTGGLTAVASQPLAAAEAEASLEGSLIGTPAYMAPEQLRGETVDARADQFAFAVALWQGLYGELPHPRKPLLRRLVEGPGELPAEPPAGTRACRAGSRPVCGAPCSSHHGSLPLDDRAARRPGAGSGTPLAADRRRRLGDLGGRRGSLDRRYDPAAAKPPL